MTSTQLQYDHFIGIDIAKKSFITASSFESKTKFFTNDEEGHKAFCKHYEGLKDKTFVTLEMTGYYELECAKYLINKGFCVHRAHGYQIKNYIKSLGIKSKTDSSDAKALALYGKERHRNLVLFKCPTKEEEELRALIARRTELVTMRTQEKNRLQAPGNSVIKKSFKDLIKHFTGLINDIENQIDILFKQNQELTEKAKIAEEISGIGKIVSKALIAGLPELGKVDRKILASLVGVAPFAKDSGEYSGYRSTGRGRVEVKKALYIAALTAARSKSDLGEFYKNLVARGKKKMVALMRKILVILNARIRDYYKLKNITVL